jgi:predicted Zn-dependent protease
VSFRSTIPPALFSAALLAALAADGSAQAPTGSTVDSDSARIYTIAELRDIGETMLRLKVWRYGRDENVERRRDVSGVIDEIQRSVGYTAHPLQWEIIGDSSMNASALPGGVMIINVGVPLFCEEYGEAPVPGDTAQARSLYLGCLAAVIGHEFGHLALGHADSLGSLIRRREEIARRDQQPTLAAAAHDSVLMTALVYGREQELEADRAGALYTLRAGWEVQDAINLFLALDSMQRSSPDWRRQGLTWIRTHPRAVERVAMLEMYRARLKLHQRDFDDALALIEYGEMPDSALAMLDRVLRDFPTLQAARHARAVVLAQQWVAGTPARQLRVRPSLPAYDARFFTLIRGAGDATVPAPVRNAFAELFHADAHPYTLSNLAVLDAYSGELAAARQRAVLAAERTPDDASVQNNLGVVLFLAGRPVEALRAFERAERAAGDQIMPAIAFNVARASAATGDTAVALRLLARYLRGDSRSRWADEARGLQRELSGGRVAADPAAPAPVAGFPPRVAGVLLGDSRSQVIAELGEPATEETEEAGVVWRYPARRIMLFMEPGPGVTLIVLEARLAGEIGGVRVGDRAADAMARLGGASSVHPTNNGIAYAYDRGSWSLILHVRGGVIHAVAAATGSE